MAGEDRRTISRKQDYDLELARQAGIRRRYLHDSVFDFVDGLPIGDSGEAAEAVKCAQPDTATSFYAALGGIATAIHGREMDIHTLSAESKAAGLLGRYGAETSIEHQEAQKEFVRGEMDINIRFLNAPLDPDHERIHALTQGLKEGTHVLFGLPRHYWVALDGIRKYGENPEQTTWKGMDPAGAIRIENSPGVGINPQIVLGRLLGDDMPIVVVEGPEQRR